MKVKSKISKILKSMISSEPFIYPATAETVPFAKKKTIASR